MSKRPAKNLTVNFINTQYACLTNGVPGVTKETVKAQIEYGDYYLYESEATDLAAKMKDKDPSFDSDAYLLFLVDVNAVRDGDPPVFGGERGTTIDSREKALEVAANPTNEQEVAEIMRLATILSDSRKSINKLLDKGVTLGIGFNSGARNKARAKAEGAEAEA
jgi:hypothetical protein